MRALQLRECHVYVSEDSIDDVGPAGDMEDDLLDLGVPTGVTRAGWPARSR